MSGLEPASATHLHGRRAVHTDTRKDWTAPGHGPTHTNKGPPSTIQNQHATMFNRVETRSALARLLSPLTSFIMQMRFMPHAPPPVSTTAL